MNKKTMVAAIRAGGRAESITVRQAEAVADDLMAAIANALVGGGRVVLTGIGILSTAATVERPGRNPRTGEKSTIAAGRRVKFAAAAALKTAIAEGAAR